MRGKWTTEELQSALAAVDEGVSVRKAASDHQIPRRTLRNHLKTGVKERCIGRPTILSAEQENELAERIKRFSEVGFPLTKKMIQSYAFEYCKKNKLDNNFNERSELAGKFWFEGFMRRNPTLTRRTSQILNKARAEKVNPVIVKDHFDKLEKIMTELQLFGKPEKIFNMDEKGCRMTLHKNQSVIAQKGAKRVHLVAAEHAENLTIVACGNAVGHVIPPMVIYKGKRRSPAYGNDLPTGSVFEMAPKGSMTHAIFMKWLKHFSTFKPIGRVLLILDGASCHLHPEIVNEADRLEISLYCLPSNTTHELQPFDKAVFKSFEHFWDVEVMKFRRNHPGRDITRDAVGKILTPAWNSSVTLSNLTSGFRATGIYPFDPDILPPEAFAPSYVTEAPGPDVTEDTENVDMDAEPCCSYSMPDVPEVSCKSHEQTVTVTNEEDDSTANQPCHMDDKTNVSFNLLLKTPKKEKKQRALRRKALNYKGNVLSKELFTEPEKTQVTQDDQLNSQPKKKARAKVSKIVVGETIEDSAWYCGLCETGKVVDMRSCPSCHSWFHDECIGMTRDDKDAFYCPDCVLRADQT